jgi:hypothetical protein
VRQWLDGPWSTPDGKQIRLPFNVLGEDKVTIEVDFYLDHVPDDSLALWFQGIIGDARMYVNGKLLKLHAFSRSGLLIPLPAAALHRQYNSLRLELLKPADTYEQQLAQPFLGLFAPVALMQHKDNRQPIQHTPNLVSAIFTSLKPCAANQPLLVLMPYSEAYGWNLDTTELDVWLVGIRSLKRKHKFEVLLPWPASPVLLKRAQKTELTLCTCSEAELFAPERNVAFWRPFPNSLPFQLVFWNDANGFATPQVGTYAPMVEYQGMYFTKPFLISLLILLLLLLAIWRLTNERSFDQLVLLRGGTLLRFQLGFPEAGSLKAGPLWLASIITHIIFCVGLVFLYDELYSLRSSLRATTLLSWLLRQPRSEAYYYVLLFSQVYLLYCFLLRGLLSWLFRLRGLVRRTFEFEAYTFYPFHLLLIVVLISMFLGQGQPNMNAIVTVGILTVMLLLYRFNSLRIGLVRTWGLPGVGVLLYICTLDLLPWLILL